MFKDNTSSQLQILYENDRKLDLKNKTRYAVYLNPDSIRNTSMK